MPLQTYREVWEETPLPLPELRSANEAFLFGHSEFVKGNFARARDLLELAVLSLPKRPEYWTVLGWSWAKLGNYERATAAAYKAVTVRSGLLDPNTLALFCHLSCHVRGTSFWKGRRLAGRTLAIVDDGGAGLGDFLNYLVFLPWLATLGGPVVLCCPERLHALFGSNPVVARGLVRLWDRHRSGWPVRDLWGTIGTVEQFWKKGRSTAELSADLATSMPRLTSEPGRVARWRQELARPSDSFVVAINWRGNPHPLPSGLKSGADPRGWPLVAAAPLAGVPGVRLISVLQGAGHEQLADCPFPVRDLGRDLDHEGAFLDTAAVLASCDLLVTSDTSVAHLAGCLGVPVWMLLADTRQGGLRLLFSDSEWATLGRHCPVNRWPVYPSMRLLFQQSTWEDLFEEVAAGVRMLRRGMEPTFRPPPPDSLPNLTNGGSRALP